MRLVGVLVTRTMRSATLRFRRNRLVELLNSLLVRMTRMTRELPSSPTPSTMEQSTSEVVAMYSGRTNVVSSLRLFSTLRKTNSVWSVPLSLSHMVILCYKHLKYLDYPTIGSTVARIKD